jgi:hypothetical protein
LNAFGVKVLIIKGSLLVFVQIWVRWTLPRLRIDQVMTTCLKYLVPISCFLFLGAVLWPLVLATMMGRTTLMEGAAAVPLGNKVSVQLRGSQPGLGSDQPGFRNAQGSRGNQSLSPASAARDEGSVR